MAEERAGHFRSLLEDLRQELRASLESNDDSTNPVSPDRAIGRLTRQDAMLAQQMALELKRRNQARLSQVEQALRRPGRGNLRHLRPLRGRNLHRTLERSARSAVLRSLRGRSAQAMKSRFWFSLNRRAAMVQCRTHRSPCRPRRSRRSLAGGLVYNLY